MNNSALDVNGRNAIVTGGARGIGAAAALALAKNGANIVIADLIDASETVDQIKAMGRQAIAVETNVALSQDVKDMVDKAIEVFGHIDILINMPVWCIEIHFSRLPKPRGTGSSMWS